MDPATSGVEVDAAGLEFVSCDGQPMAETAAHAQQMVILHQSLVSLAARRGWSDAYAGTNQLHYWDPRDARSCLAPDVYFARGIVEPARLRETWRTWVEGKGPDLVIEVASSSTWKLDVGRKREVYRGILGVQEYLIVDPVPDDPIPGGPLLAWRRTGRGSYRRVATTSGRFHSQVLGVDLVMIDDQLRVVDEDGRVIPALALEALAAGHAEGRAHEARRLLERQLRRRFPAISAALLGRLHGGSIEDLERWLDRVVEASSADDVFGGA